MCVYTMYMCVYTRCVCGCVYTHTRLYRHMPGLFSDASLSYISLLYTHIHSYILLYINIIQTLSLSLTFLSLSLSLSLSLCLSLSLSLSLMYTQMQAPEAIECRRGLQLLRASGRDLSLECVLHRMCSL